MSEKQRHYEESSLVAATPNEIFGYADNHRNFSAHMNKSSVMMVGSSMNTHPDEKNFQEVGSHLRMDGNVLGIKLFLDEVVTQYNPPFQKEWQTVGDLSLVVIDHYQLGFKIEPENINSKLTVYINYDLPKAIGAYLVGYLFGEMYAKWCVRQMLNGVKKHFKSI